MLKLKIFQGLLSHLHGNWNYKQDTKDEGNQLSLKKKILAGESLHTS